MEKIGLLKNERMGDYEKKEGYASYRTLVNYFIGDLVLCNSVAEVDLSVWDNLEFAIENEEGDTVDIYQYYLCNLSEWDKKQAIKAGLLLSYSDMLGCDVLCVDHWGTSWDYVLTSVKLFDNYEELEAYEKGEN